VKVDNFIDRSKVVTSSKYGKTQIQKVHPAWNDYWQTTNRDAFKDPGKLERPTFREGDRFAVNQRQTTKLSGFAANHAEGDGLGWKPDPVLKGDINRTEYRDRFHSPPFHRDTRLSVKPQLPVRPLTYKFA
jgi:hypothetical protein